MTFMHPTDPRETVEGSGCRSPLLPGLPERLHGGSRADLIPKLEAVGDRFGGGVNRHRNPGDEGFLNPFPKRRAGKVMVVEAEGFDSWGAWE